MTARKLVALRPDLLTERDLSGLVVELASLGGWKRYHTFDSRRSNHGFPDWVFVKNGRLLFVELKSQQGKVRDEQAAWLDALSDVPNVEVYLWRPTDWDEIVTTLTGKRPRKEQAA